MTIAGWSEENRAEAVESTLREMEALGKRMRELIAAQPPLDLLGYIYGEKLCKAMNEMTAEQEQSSDQTPQTDVTQFLLEYVHAVLASTPTDGTSFDEVAGVELFDCASKLIEKSMLYAIISTGAAENVSAYIQFQAMANWVSVRGKRYPVLEGEFYEFALEPHDSTLREIYGIGAKEIATGFQKIANSLRSGHADAAETIAGQVDAAADLAESKKKLAAQAFEDLLWGGICSVSRHTQLPPVLLADLAYQRGEENDFFDDGPFSGTPFRTLPARMKPLIKINENYYTMDTSFIRDSGYRALIYNMLQKKQEYKKDFRTRQQKMSESAFFKIFDHQLSGAVIHQEVWYKDPVTKNWFENDTLIVIDDMLILVEAKAGTAATIASPALDFTRHELAIQELVINAYTQCKRFFEYMASSPEVPIFRFNRGRYEECDRLKISDYRIMIPIGLTVESFAPFSANCKNLRDDAPVLGKHPFISLSIDDLFVLKRFLPTTGELAHYFEVRQAVAAIRGAYLFDEADHLGSYISKNRFDIDLLKQITEKSQNLVIWDGMSRIIDSQFEGCDWETRPVATQYFPTELLGLLRALNRSRAPGWLAAESLFRTYGDEGKQDVADQLAACRATLDKYPYRYFSFFGDSSVFVWLTRADVLDNHSLMKAKASTAALSGKAQDMIAIIVIADPIEGYISAERFDFDLPPRRTPATNHIFEDATRMLSRQKRIFVGKDAQPAAGFKKTGRNEPCWCGSGAKFKKCHGP